MMDKEKIEKLEKLWNVATESLSRGEFTKAFELLTKLIVKVEEKLIQKIDVKLFQTDSEIKAAIASTIDSKKEFEQVIKDTKVANETTFNQIRQKANESINNLFSRLALQNKFDAFLHEYKQKYEQKILSLDEKIAKVPIIDVETISKSAVALIPEVTSDDIRNKLEILEGEDEKLRISAIGHLREELDELKRMRQIRGSMFGGGTSAIGVASAMGFAGRTETPSGAINSSNVTYTVTKPINFIFSFMINGQSIPSADYSVSGRTITMDTALDSSLSGTEFEIKYI